MTATRRGFDLFSVPAIIFNIAMIALCTAPVYAQQAPQPKAAGDALAPAQAAQQALRPPRYVIPRGTEISTLYVDGSQVENEIEERWNFMCGSNTIGMGSDDLRAIAEAHAAEMADGPAFIVDNGRRGAGINII